MRLSERYSGMAWLERLGSDSPAGTRVLPVVDAPHIPSLLERLDSAFAVSVELSMEGVLWRLRCIPHDGALRRMGYRVGISYLAGDIGDALRAAIADYEEISSGAYLGVFGQRPVDREVR